MGHTDFNVLGPPGQTNEKCSQPKREDWILLEVPTPKVNLSKEAKSRTEIHGYSPLQIKANGPFYRLRVLSMWLRDPGTGGILSG